MPARTRLSRFSAAFAAVVVAAATMLAAPAAAQYGGGGSGTMTFFVSPVRVPVDQTFLGFGTGCDDGDEVQISIDGVPGVLATTTAGPPGGNFSVSDVPLPDGLMAGDDHDVRATCENGDSLTFTITLVCPSGDDPVDGSCEDGSDGTVGGSGPTTTTTTTTTTPDGSGGTTGGSGPGGSDGGTDGSPPLAFTGAAFTGWLLQAAMTLVGIGGLIVVAARRRLSDDASVA